MSWGSIDFSAARANLPPPGPYAATITDVRLYDKPDVLWMGIEFSLDGTDAAPRGMLHAIAAREGSQHKHKMAEGLRAIAQLAIATGVTLEGIAYEALPGKLIGKRLELIVAHVSRDGILDLVVRSMRPLPASV
jgi:hypothetical protein